MQTMTVASQLLSSAGTFVKSVNPSLLTSPPPSTEESGHDVCYLGPNGEDDPHHIIYCEELPEGQRAMVGSWYIDPERHVIEYIAFVTISSIIIRLIIATLPKYPSEKADNLNPPRFLKIATFFIYTCQLAYKINGYPGKILFMAMPCNVLWTMWASLCFLPIPTQIRHIMYQLTVPYTSLAIVALATPDVSDLKMWMEVPFFFFMHYALLVYPIYFLYSGRISVLPSSTGSDGMVSNFLKWWTLSCAYFALFYFGVAVPLSVVFGINLNYMLSPPPSPDDMISGPNFRLQSTLCCAAVFFFIQFVVTAAAVFGRAVRKIPIPSSRKSV
mmetsp:Transcript_45508/g.95538  ORF Transcript_45508/g.95538 Transcript_45508/m.95538 type:complete len:329 (-) Transcript_45508:168-1154(-)